MKRFRVLFCAGAVLLCAACGLLVEEGRDVVAEVDKEPIRLNDLLREIRNMPFEQRAKTNDDDMTVRLKARRAVLEAMVVERLLADEAKALGIDVSDEEVDLAFERKEQHDEGVAGLVEGMKGGGADHEHAHEGEGHSRDEIKQMHDRLMINKMLMLELSEASLRKFYDEHAQEFKLASPIVRYELLVVDAPHSKVIDAIHKKVAQGGTTLTGAFESLENPPQAIFLGLTPPTPLSNILPEMREKVEKLEKGQLSEPFRIHTEDSEQYGVAVCIGRIDRAPFDSVKQRIYWKLYVDLVNRLKQKYEIVYHEDKLNYRLDR